MELAVTRCPWKADNRFTEELLRTSEEADRPGASTTTAAEVVAAAAMAAIVDVAAQIAKRNLQNANCQNSELLLPLPAVRVSVGREGRGDAKGDGNGEGGDGLVGKAMAMATGIR